MSIKDNFKINIRACYIAYITQAIAINFAPLLFLTFCTEYGISVAQIGSLIAITFIIQIAVDLISASYVEKIGYKACAIFAHILSGVGFIMLGILPDLFSNGYMGILVACFFYSFGSGLIEVLVSPIVEACSTDNKESAMGFLHSFYCWGTAIVILVSTIFLKIFGLQSWRFMAFIWSLVPLCNVILFSIAPMPSVNGGGQRGGILGLLKTKIVWIVILMMLASGAAELAMSQWASTFAESGLNISKAMGDLAGPFLFAILMGIGRVVYSVIVNRMSTLKYMSICAIVCIVGYLLVAINKNEVVSLIGCGLVGLSVGVFWPGTLSYAAQRCGGSASLFGLLAFSGDLGCSIGPAMVGYISATANNNLVIGLAFSVIFPIILLVITLIAGRQK